MKLPHDLRAYLADLRSQRRERKRSGGRRPRASLSTAERQHILSKTSGRCHICGGMVEGAEWQADHVMAHSAGGKHEIENYLPAHSVCNNYRWDYLPEEFQYILKLGVWAKTQIERGSSVGNEIASLFLGHEARRTARRKSSNGAPAANKRPQ